MATAILPAQDCLDEDRALMCNPRRKSNLSKMKSVGGTQECYNGKLNPKMSALNPHYFQKNGSFLSPSSSYVNSENLAFRNMTPTIMQLPQGVASNLSYLPGYSNTCWSPWESVYYGSRALQSSVDAKKLNGTNHQASRSFSYKGFGDSQQKLGQKGVKGFLPEKTEGSFRKEGFIDGMSNRKIGNDLQMGQITILKKGEATKHASLTESALTHLLKPFSSGKDEIPEKSRTVEASKRGTKISAKSRGLYQRGDIGKEGKLNSDGIVITSTDHLGPDPSNLPREGSGLLRSVSSASPLIENAPRSSWEAGDNMKVGGNPDPTIFGSKPEKRGVPAFTNSPPPSCLPLPKFSLKQNGKPARTQVGVNTMATRDLRRLLGLD